MVSASAVCSPAIAKLASAVLKLICASAEPFEFYLVTKQISDVVDAIEDHGGPAQIWKRYEMLCESSTHAHVSQWQSAIACAEAGDQILV